MGGLRLKERRKISREDRQDARELIERIRRNNGKHEEFLATLDPKDAEIVEEIIRPSKQMANNTILELTHNNYSKPGRYISELIQNADDCEYSIAQREGEVPTLWFHLRRDQLIVASNEDGFCEAHVRSICSMRCSSKTSGKHTGHKGIGFKSVFVIASKVHVRSDPYSFAFTPEQVGQEKGLSLVIPSNEESEDLTSQEGTRFVLHLDARDCKHRVAELHDIKVSDLLFLKKLRKIVVRIDVQGTEGIMTYTRQDDGASRKIINTTVEPGIEPSTSFRRYLTKSRRVHTLPANAHGPRATSGRVELAFPVKSDDGARIESRSQHYVYACLPVQKFEFGTAADFDQKFHINADFDVTANRESVQDTPRNRTLRSEIAKAFCEQITQFVKDPNLRYTWPVYYLPTTPKDDFWVELQNGITEQLQRMPLFWARANASLLSACDIYHLPSSYCDNNGDPLFDHVCSEHYLAKEYPKEFLNKLKSLGVKELPRMTFIDHVAQDLNMEDSRIKTFCATDEDDKDWHQNLAQVLLHLLEENRLGSASTQAIKALEIIPLTDGRWVSHTKSIFFDTSASRCAIPDDVKLKIISNTALPTKTWRPVFEWLGISPIQPSDVVEEIERMHFRWHNDQASFHRDQIGAHLRYFYWNADKDYVLSPGFFMRTDVGKNFKRLSDSTRRWYLKDSGNEHGSWALLSSYSHSDVQFLHPKIADLVSEADTNLHGRTWGEWLKMNVGIRSVPSILAHPVKRSIKLSSEFDYIVHEESEWITRFLWQNSSAYRYELKNASLAAGEVIQNIEVPTAGPLVCAISETYLPTKELLDHCKILGIRGPLLSELDNLLNSSSSDDNAKKLLIKYFGVRENSDVDFYVKALMELQYSQEPKHTDQQAVKVIYGRLYSEYRERSLDPDSRTRVENSFKQSELVLYHNPVTHDQEWLSLSDCIWDTDDGLFTDMISIRSQYADLEDFFVTHLNINTPSLYMYVNHLSRRLADLSPGNTEIIKRIIAKISSVIDIDLSSDAGTDEGLDDGGEESSDTDSGDSHKFGCSIRSPSMKSKGKIVGDKHNLISVSDDDYASESDIDDATAFEKLNSQDFEFLPIRMPDASHRLVSSRATFVIPDLYHLRRDFKDKVPMLDFTLTQIHDCRKLIQHLGLSSNLLSRLGEYEVKISDSHENQMETGRLRAKAAAFCGCLKRFMYMNDKELTERYIRLSNAKVLDCDGILKRFHLKFGSALHRGGWKRARLHSESKEGSDCFFIPREREQRELCNIAEFPQAIIELLEVKGSDAVSAITTIFGASTQVVAETWMENANIPLWLYNSSDSEPEESDGLDGHCSLASSNSSSTTSSVEDVSSADELSMSVPQQMSYQLPHRSRISRINPGTNYVSILRNVFREAHTTTFPENGTKSLSQGSDEYTNLRFGDIFSKQDWSTDKRHAKVGAAGELFIFEMLSGMLSDFDFENWTSTIRDYVSGLEDFAEIGKWEGRHETTDLQYRDMSGKLTKLLIKKKYLEAESVVKHPTYLIEVKTSVNECESGFYVSNKQYRMMEDFSIEDDKRAAKIYMLCRVFNVDHKRIGLRVFVDPWKANGMLDFEADRWLVKCNDS